MSGGRWLRGRFDIGVMRRRDGKVMIWAEQMEKAKAVLTIGEVAEMLRIHPTTVYRLLKRGDIPGFKIGGNWRVSVNALDRWMSEMGLLPR